MTLHIPASATVTIKGSDGKPIQVSQAMVAQAQLGLVQPSADGTVTLPGPDGKPVKIPQAALATAASSLPSITAGNQQCKQPICKSKNFYTQNTKIILSLGDPFLIFTQVLW